MWSLLKKVPYHTAQLHRVAFCQFPFRSIEYNGSNKSTGMETAKTHLCALLKYFKQGVEKNHACQIQLWIFRPELKNTDCKKYSNIQRNECTPIGTDL